MFMSSVISNHHRICSENFGLPLNALNGSDQNLENGPTTSDDESFSPSLFSPISFSNHGRSLFSSPTYPRQKTNSISPINSPTPERQVGGRTYGVMTLADTYHVTNSEEFGLMNNHFFDEHLRPEKYQQDTLPTYEHALQTSEVFGQTTGHVVWDDDRIPTPRASTDTSFPQGSGSIRIISHASSTLEMSSDLRRGQLEEKQPIRKKRMRHVICGITAVVTVVAVPTLILFLTSLRTDDKQTNVNTALNTTTSVPRASVTGKPSSRSRRYIFWPRWSGKRTKLDQELEVSVLKD
ncbi:uncharacterized protein LOC121388952 [Gigantopelta aegis]|uniref:uncharacterized protein LOC121388952 n=1 Tax=Gigantopelta aegis TaxID=1735272 RepID=UPI001B88D744|nr:uncharacterized protein LOC121388952 [Gigantopelta aegis]